MKFEKEILADYEQSLRYIKGLLNGPFVNVKKLYDPEDVFNEAMILIQSENEYSFVKLKSLFSRYLSSLNVEISQHTEYDDTRLIQGKAIKQQIHQSEKQCSLCQKVFPIQKIRPRSKRCFSCHFKNYSQKLSDYYIKERIKIDGYYKGCKIIPTNEIIKQYRERIQDKRARRSMSKKEKRAYWRKSASKQITDGYAKYLFKKATRSSLGHAIVPNDDQVIRMKQRIKELRQNKSLLNKPLAHWFPELKNV